MPNSPPSPERAQTVARLFLAVALTALGIWTLWEFIPALVWAGILAIGIWPAYCKAQRHFPQDKHNILLPSVFTLLIGASSVASSPLAATSMRSSAMHAA